MQARQLTGARHVTHATNKGIVTELSAEGDPVCQDNIASPCSLQYCTQTGRMVEMRLGNRFLKRRSSCRTERWITQDNCLLVHQRRGMTLPMSASPIADVHVCLRERRKIIIGRFARFAAGQLQHKLSPISTLCVGNAETPIRGSVAALMSTCPTRFARPGVAAHL
jgi:hypothetical protein